MLMMNVMVVCVSVHCDPLPSSCVSVCNIPLRFHHGVTSYLVLCGSLVTASNSVDE